MFKGYFTVIVTHDFLFFCTRDYNAEGIMEQVVGNYSIMYALNTDINEIHRIISGTKPFYSQDLEKMRIYATPSYPLFRLKISHELLSNIVKSSYQEGIKYEEQKKVKFKYNTAGESTAFGMKQAILNIPNLGTYEKLNPLNILCTFTFGDRGPSVIRLGKKQVPCRVHYYQIENISEVSGIYEPDHPININEFDFQPKDIISGEILYIKPTPLIINAKLKGKFLKCQIDKSEFYILLPNRSLYPKIFQ